MKNFLIAKNIKKSFTFRNQTFEILKNISYTFEQNKSYAITGLSGSGKSTLVHILASIEPVTSGTILFNNSKTNSDFLLDDIGVVFQESFLIKELTVIENIMLKGLITNQNYDDCYNYAMFLLKKIGLQEKANQSAMVLSGGQKQRISILRAIFNKPKFLLADEPTGNLDEKTAQDIIEFLLTCKQEWNMGLIISTHDKSLEKQMDVSLEIKNGELFEKEKYYFVEKNCEASRIDSCPLR